MLPTAEYIVSLMKADFPDSEWQDLKPTKSYAWDIKVSNEDKNERIANISTRSFSEVDPEFLIDRANVVMGELEPSLKPFDRDKLKDNVDVTKPVYVNFELRIWD